MINQSAYHPNWREDHSLSVDRTQQEELATMAITLFAFPETSVSAIGGSTNRQWIGSFTCSRRPAGTVEKKVRVVRRLLSWGITDSFIGQFCEVDSTRAFSYEICSEETDIVNFYHTVGRRLHEIATASTATVTGPLLTRVHSANRFQTEHAYENWTITQLSNMFLID